MNDFTEDSGSDRSRGGVHAAASVDLSRRKLLRAAAAAPVLATIPSGAAFANASAYQCVITSKEQSDAGVPLMSRRDQDQWVRLAVTQQDFGTLDNGNPVTKTGWLIDGNWYDDTGAPFTPNFDPSCDFTTEFCPITEPQPALVLAIYQPVPDGIAPTSVTPAAAGFQAFYPITSTEGNRPSEVGNIGLFVSCYCSVAPDIQSPDAIQQALMALYC